MRINFAKPRWCCKEQWSEFFLLLKCSVTWLSFLSPPCVVMRSKLTSGCSFAETGQVILSAEIMKRKYIWEGKSYWGCLPKVWVLSKCLVCWNTCCCFVLKGNGWNTDVLNQIYPLSLVAAIIYRAISTLLWYLHLWKGIVKQLWLRGTACCAPWHRGEAPLLLHISFLGLQLNLCLLLLLDGLCPAALNTT